MSQVADHPAPTVYLAEAGTAPAAFLALDQVRLDYGAAMSPHPAVDGVSLYIAEGEFHCLLGRSGCGKTSLLQMAAGLLAPTSGQVRVQGQPPAARRADIGFVFQTPTLLAWQSALDNVLLPISLQGRPTAADRERALALFDRLGLAGLHTRRPRQLSGGQQSRVAIARALVTGPRLLLLDEPFAALDAITREELQQDLLRACREADTTVLFVTHDLQEALFLADRIHVMHRGRLVQAYAPDLPRQRDAALRATPAFANWGGQLREALREALSEASRDALPEAMVEAVPTGQAAALTLEGTAR